MPEKTLTPEHYYELRKISNRVPDTIAGALKDFLKENKPKHQRTPDQNKALHVDYKLIADKLNDAGIEQHAFFKAGFHIPYTTNFIKDMVWRPIQMRMYGKKSTTELEKTGEIENIHDVIMRDLGENHGIEYHEFPHDPEKKKDLELMQGHKMHEGVEYPDEDLSDKEIPF